MSFIDEVYAINKRLKLFPLAGIITGMEHSGTTLLSNLITSSVKHIDNGFECGALLANAPSNFRDIQPFYDWLCLPSKIGHWGLTPAMREWICQTESWEVFYSRLRGVYSLTQEKEIHQMIDKTPAYVFQLQKVREKIGEHIPVIVTSKKIDLLYASYKRRNIPLDNFESRYYLYKRSLSEVKKMSNVLLIKHQDMVLNQTTTVEACRSHLGIKESHERTAVSTSLNYRINPLKEGYSLEDEQRNADLLLTATEKDRLKNIA